MKDEISALDLYYLVKEFQVLEGAKVEKIHQKDKSFLFAFHIRSAGKKLLKISLPGLIYLSEHKEDYAELPGFCGFLRKKLLKTTVMKIEQKGFERILQILFQGKDVSYQVIIELFGNGNLIVCDMNYKILSALENKNWGYRTLRGGVTYEFPPVQTNTLALSKQEFWKNISHSEKESIVKTLAIDFNLGGVYAEELCILAGINKEKKNLVKADSDKLFSTLQEVLKKNVSPVVVEKQIFPFILTSQPVSQSDKYESFSEAIDAVFAKKINNDNQQIFEKKHKDEINKILQIIKQQELALENMKKGESENQKKGELIYENYTLLTNLLSEFNEIRKKHSWAEIKKTLKNHKVIKQVNEQEGLITIEL